MLRALCWMETRATRFKKGFFAGVFIAIKIQLHFHGSRTVSLIKKKFLKFVNKIQLVNFLRSLHFLHKFGVKSIQGASVHNEKHPRGIWEASKRQPQTARSSRAASSLRLHAPKRAASRFLVKICALQKPSQDCLCKTRAARPKLCRD